MEKMTNYNETVSHNLSHLNLFRMTVKYDHTIIPHLNFHTEMIDWLIDWLVDWLID